MIDAEGTFTEEFNPTQILGEGYEDYKGLDEVKTLPALVKFAADNHRTARQKLDSVIQKPAEDAGDDVKAEYRNTLKTELGIPASEGEYNWPQPEKDEQGNDVIVHTDQTKAFWNHVFKNLDISQSQAGELIAKTAEFNTMAAEQAKKDLDAQVEQDMKEDIEAFDKLYPGEKKPEALRHAIKAFEQFGSETLNKAIKNLNLYDVHDLRKWADVIPLNNLPFMVNVGKNAANTTMPKGEGHEAPTDARISAIAAAHNTSVEEVKRAMANYPNSWQSMYPMTA
jgi:hypothetical protein